MYRLLIVDDEDVIRDGLVNTIDWKSMGFSVVSTARNGREALDILETVQPDVILADIRMPRLSGIELAKSIQTDYPEIKVVILTGYDHFEYAQEAIEHNIFSYLLKPYNSIKLTEVFSKLKNILDKRNRVSNLSIRANQTLINEELFQWIKKEILLDNTLLLSKWLLEHKGLYIYLFIDIDHSFIKNLQNKEYDSVAAFVSLENKFWLVSEMSPDVLEGNIKKITEAESTVIYHAMYKFVHEPGLELDTIIEKLNKVNQLVFFYESSIVHAQDIEKKTRKPDDTFFSNKVILDIVAAIKKENLEEIKDLLRFAYKVEKNKNLFERKIVNNLVSKWIRTLWKELANHNLIDEIEIKKISLIVDRIQTFSSFCSLTEYIFLKIVNATKNAGLKIVNTSNLLIVNTLSIIQLRYKESLSLDLIANELEISSSHLSRLFKKELGINFKDYLKNFRISIAKEKLKNTTLKIYEIAEDVGYSEQTYFSDIFKRTVGCSPLRYRNKIWELDQ